MAQGTFPIIKGPQELGVTPTTAVRANIDVRTGEGAVGAAIGEGLLGLARQWELMNAKTQLSESTVAAADAETRFLLGLQGNDDVETYGTELDKLFAELDTLAPKNRRAAEIYNMQRANQRVSLFQTTQKMAKDKLKSKAQLADFLLLQKAKDSGDPNDVIAYKASVINNEKLANAYGAKAAEALLDSIDREVELAKKKRQILADEALEAKQELDRDKIGKAIVDGTADYALIDNSSLPETEQETYRIRLNTEIARRAKGEVIITNAFVSGELYNDSLDIWRGTKSKPEFDSRLFNARYGKMIDGKLKYAFEDTVSDKPLLDDATYTKLAENAARTLKNTQAEALRRADIEAGRLLVDFRNENAFAKFISDSIKGLEPDIAEVFEKDANERRQIQFWYLGRYNAELRDWIEKHPDKTGKEFFQFSEELKHQYWNTSIEEIKNLRVAREREFAIEDTPAKDELIKQAQNATSKERQREIYEQGKQLGYWK